MKPGNHPAPDRGRSDVLNHASGRGERCQFLQDRKVLRDEKRRNG
jgi:hypothetical protein